MPSSTRQSHPTTLEAECTGLRARPVQQHQSRRHGNQLPVVGSAADIENASLRADAALTHEAEHAPPAEAPGERVDQLSHLTFYGVVERNMILVEDVTSGAL